MIFDIIFIILAIILIGVTVLLWRPISTIEKVFRDLKDEIERIVEILQKDVVLGRRLGFFASCGRDKVEYLKSFFNLLEEVKKDECIDKELYSIINSLQKSCINAQEIIIGVDLEEKVNNAVGKCSNKNFYGLINVVVEVITERRRLEKKYCV